MFKPSYKFDPFTETYDTGKTIVALLTQSEAWPFIFV